MTRSRSLLSLILSICLVLLGADLAWVLFFGGLNVHLGPLEVRSTTMEFPLIAFLSVLILLLVVGSRWREALLLCGALVVASVLTEIGLRIVDHPLSKPYLDYVAWYEPSEVYGHQLVPGFEGIGPLNVPVRINSHGFRDIEHTLEKGVTLRILALGDSFTFGWGVSFEQTYLQQLEQMLQGATGKRIETINTGVPGWGLNQYYLFLKKVGVQYAPDIIVLAYFVDDLYSSIIQEAIPVNEQYRPGLQYKGGILHHSRFYNFTKSLADQIRYKNRVTRIPYLHSLDARRQEWSSRQQYLISVIRQQDDDKYMTILHMYLQRINQIAKESNALLVVMFIPDLSQLHHQEVQYINRLLADNAREINIPFVDMTPIFEQSSELNTYYLWPHDGHTNANGHFAMAKALTNLICRGLRSPTIDCHAPQAAQSRFTVSTQ